MSNFSPNPMWESIIDDLRGEPLKDFKNSKINRRIAQYNPETHGVFFFKTLLYWSARQMPSTVLELLNRIPGRLEGNPVTISHEGVEVDLDYLQAVDEFRFLEEILPHVRTVLEIGAGYGRTCHTLLSLARKIERYTIVDLQEIIRISQSYLREVLEPSLFARIEFIAIDQFAHRDREISADLMINIDSMQEMSGEVARNYLNFIARAGRWFYTKNTLGKFRPEDFGWTRGEKTKMALASGLITEEIDIFEPRLRADLVRTFIDRFRPGPEWKVVKDGEFNPWIHYHQVLFAANR